MSELIRDYGYLLMDGGQTRYFPTEDEALDFAEEEFDNNDMRSRPLYLVEGIRLQTEASQATHGGVATS